MRNGSIREVTDRAEKALSQLDSARRRLVETIEADPGDDTERALVEVLRRHACTCDACQRAIDVLGRERAPTPVENRHG